jgi:hypothetical protein
MSSDDYSALPGVLARLPKLRQIYLEPSPDLPMAVRDAFLEGLAGLTHLSVTLSE